MTSRARVTVLALVVLAAAGCSAGGDPAGTAAPPAGSASVRSDSTPSTVRSTVSNPQADAQLLAAAAAGDVAGVRSALAAGADLETRDDHRRTPLLLAVAADRVEVAQVLVAAGADPDALDDRHDTPWLVTGVTGSVEMGKALLPAGPDMTIRNRYGGVSVIPASERGHVEYVRWVVTTGIDVNHVNDLGWTALLEAVILGDGGARHVEIVKTLLAAGADPALADRDGVTALQHAQRSGYREMAAALGG